jgi:hypothetical protein
MGDEQEVQQQSPTVLITYDIRDLLDRFGKDMAAGFAAMGEKLDNKADKADVAAIQKDIVHISDRVTKLESTEETRREVVHSRAEHVRTLTERSQRRWNYFLSIGVIVGSLGSGLVGHFVR